MNNSKTFYSVFEHWLQHRDNKTGKIKNMYGDSNFTTDADGIYLYAEKQVLVKVVNSKDPEVILVRQNRIIGFFRTTRYLRMNSFEPAAACLEDFHNLCEKESRFDRIIIRVNQCERRKGQWRKTFHRSNMCTIIQDICRENRHKDFRQARVLHLIDGINWYQSQFIGESEWGWKEQRSDHKLLLTAIE